MYRFFRKIRQRLLSRNRLGNYLLYAIGEIFLVVIGILIAIQINNWNEDRKAVAKERIYLEGLSKDLSRSKKDLERVIEKTDRVFKNSDTLIDLLRRSEENFPVAAIDSILMISTGYTVFMPSEGVVQDILSSGQLSLLTNRTLREQVAAWEANHSMIREWESLSKRYSTEYFEDCEAYIDLSNSRAQQNIFLSERQEELRKDINIRNKLERTMQASFILNALYRDQQAFYDTLLVVIEEELE